MRIHLPHVTAALACWLPMVPGMAQEEAPLPAPASLHAEGETFAVRSLWRSERALDAFAREGVAICDAVARASGAGARDSRLEIGLAPSPRGLRRMTEAAPQHALSVPAVPFAGREVPALAVWPLLHDRVLFLVQLPPATRRQLAVQAACMVLPGDASELAGARLVAAQKGLEAVGASRPMLEEPWTSSGFLALQRLLRGAEDGDAVLARLLDEAVVDPSLATVLAPGTRHAATAAQAAAILRSQSPEAPLGELQRTAMEMQPLWEVESGAVATHGFGWCATGSGSDDALMLSALPVDAERYSISTEFFVLSNNKRFPAQADVAFGGVGEERFLLACNSVEGIYLFRRRSDGSGYDALSERKDVRVPVGQRLQVRIDVDQDRINITVGGVALDPVRVADRPLSGVFGLGAHVGSTALFKEPVVELR